MTSTPLAGPPVSPQGMPGAAPPLGSIDPQVALALMIQEQVRIDALKSKLTSWANRHFDIMKNARLPIERQWQINLAFYNGRHYIMPVTVAGAGYRLMAPKAPAHRVRMVINKVRVAVRTECSKLSSSKPIPVVIPATTEDEDLAASRVAEQILKSYLGNADHDAKVRLWVWWGSVTGTGYIKSWWDGNRTDDRAFVTPKPPPELVALQNEELMNSWFASPDAQPRPAQGIICEEVVNPFQLYVPDLLADDIEDQPYLMHVMTKSPEYIKQTFDINATPDSKAANTIMESAILQPKGVNNDSFDSCLVKEIWVKPGGLPDFPSGGMFTVVSNQVVQLVENWPCPFKDYPFYPYEGIPTGHYYKESVVTDLIPIQKEYNKTKSQMLEIKNQMQKPKFIGYRGSFNPRQVSSEPGQSVLVTPGYELPTILPGVEVPSTMGAELDRLNSDFDDISGQHEITRGDVPSQVTSGTAINFLQEQDDGKLYYQVAGIERSTAKLGRHFLAYAVKYWEPERLVKIVGRDGDFEAQHWQQNTMKGNTDVIVQSGSALPHSKAAKQAFITDLMAQGFIDPTVGLEVLDLQSLDKILEDYLVDKRQAQRENMKMSNLDPAEVGQLHNPPVGKDGLPTYGKDPATGKATVPLGANGMPFQPQSVIPVNSWDNHQAHIQWHNQFRKTQQFDLLPEELKQEFEIHVQTHQMAGMLPQMGQAGIVANQENAGMDPNAPQADPDAQVEAQEPAGQAEPNEPQETQGPPQG